MKVSALADACFCDAKGRGPTKTAEPYPQGYVLMDAFRCMVSVDTKAISADGLSKGKTGIEIGEMIRVARIDAIRSVTQRQIAW